MNYYAKAIDILANNAPDKILRQIAKVNPAAVCKAYDTLHPGPPPPPWEIEAKELCVHGRKIDAIKLCRLETGIGLREARDKIEEICYNQIKGEKQ